MKQRWLVAIVGLPLLLLVLLACPQWATTLLVCAISGVAAYELLHVAGKNIGKAVYAVTILCAVAQVWVIYDVRKWYEVTVPLRGGAPFDKCLILPWVLVMFLFYEAVARYGKGNDLPFTDVATGHRRGCRAADDVQLHPAPALRAGVRQTLCACAVFYRLRGRFALDGLRDVVRQA